MKISEAMRLLKVTRMDIIYLIKRGYLSSTRYGTNNRFHDVNPESVQNEIKRRSEIVPIPPPNPSGLCLCGCGNPVPITNHTTRDRGLKAGEFVRFLPGHHDNGWALCKDKYVVNPKTQCWEWQRSRTPEGYPKRMRVGGKSIAPHHYYYSQKHGVIPRGYEIDHTCKNTRCVNPDHLEAVTKLENNRRSSHTKLNVKDVAAIRQLHSQGFSKRKLGRMFGVTHSNISDVINRVIWKDV